MSATMRANCKWVIRTILDSSCAYCNTSKNLCFGRFKEYMRHVRFLGSGLLFLVAVACAVAQGSDPRSVVEEFYRFDTAHSQVFNRRNIEARKRWFTDVLQFYFEKELTRQREY